MMNVKNSEKTKKTYMIHCCPQRRWYVDNHLVPSMLKQGIQKDDIVVWNDSDGLGNLESFMRSLRWIGKTQPIDGGIWHLQDDVVIASNFREVAEMHDSGIVSGFCNEKFDGGNVNYIGIVPVAFGWFSFQCVRIPNRYAIECADWYYNECVPQNLLADLRKDGKNDDSVWKHFISTKHPEETCHNLLVNIVDHVDYLIGGSIANKQRGEQRRGYRFEDGKAVEQLEAKLKRIRTMVSPSDFDSDNTGSIPVSAVKYKEKRGRTKK